MRLERDVVGRDDYGRLLAYVYRVDDGVARQRGDRPPGLRPPADDRAERGLRRAVRRRRRSPPRPTDSACGRRAADSVAPVADPSRWLTPSLAERLGHPADARLVIISCDDLGLCHAANVGVYRALRDGAATCASLMVPAPWARHAAAMYEPGDDIGVHLTLNAEHPNYRWGPITHAPSLLVRRRRVPPLDRRPVGARRPRRGAPGVPGPDRAGAGVGHRRHPPRPAPDGDHAAAGVLRRLPRHGRRVRACRSACRRRSRAEQAGFPFRRLAAEEGVVFPDHFDHDWRAGSRDRVYAAIRDLQPGVTEIHVQPAIDTPEVRALSPAADGLDRRPRAGRRRSEGADAARRGRRRADRLQRAQGRAASAAELGAPASPERSRSNSGPVGPVDFSLPCM